ncbi:MAG: FAD-binding protein [Oscillospiraceae bacterium]|nr:FAD-binding protein [Oscillospiraceae bacterium]
MGKEKKEKKQLSRREFLKGAGAVTAGAAAVSILGMGAFASNEPDAATGASVSTGGSSGGSGDTASTGTTTDDRVYGYSGPGDWLGEAPEIADSDISKTLECDVAVIGLGHAGTQALLAAAEKGAKVIGVEKQTQDTHSWFGEDFGCWNSQVQVEQAGFGPYDLGEVVDEFITRGGGRAYPDIVRLYVQNSGPTMDHMLEICKEMGVDSRVYTYDNTRDGWLIIQANFDYDKWASGADIYDCLRKDYPIWPGTKTWAASCQFMGEYNDTQVNGVAANSKIGLVQQACLDKATRDLGAELIYNASGVVLVQDSSKAVTGVIVQDNSTGEYIRINTAKGVVMAGGDYSANADMCWALLNEYMERNERSGGSKSRFYSSGRDGSSVKMMCWAGGYIEPAPRGTMILGGGPSGGPWGANSMLWLNAEGKRFCNEGNITAAQTATSRQKKGTGCLVTDQKWFKGVCASGLEHQGPNGGRPQYYQDMIDGMNALKPGGRANIIGCTIAERMSGSVMCGETLEDIAKMVGYDDEATANMLEAVARYNEMCYAGQDTDFGKRAEALIPVDEGPYYACTGTMGSFTASPSMVTMSGVMTDARLNVLDGSMNPIKGLYTCGNSLGGRYGTGYCTPCAGSSIGMAGTHGRLAGQFVCEDN